MNIDTDEFQKVVHANAFALLNFKESVRMVVLNAFANFATGDNLIRLGRDRNLPKLQGENEVEYRARILNAWEANIGSGDVYEIIRRITAVGYTFNSFEQGDTSGGDGSFNLLTRSTGAIYLDGSHVLDGSWKLDSPDINSFTIEIVEPFSLTEEEKARIRAAISPVLRASSKPPKIIAIV